MSNDGSATPHSLLSSPAHQAGCPSGQREQTVNLSAQPTKVRTLHPPPPARTAPDLRKRSQGPFPLSGPEGPRDVQRGHDLARLARERRVILVPGAQRP